jgi:hypothetical protein
VKASRLIAEVNVYGFGDEPFSCARRNGEDTQGLARIAKAWLEDGAERVTVSVRGTEYELDAWLDYIGAEVTE